MTGDYFFQTCDICNCTPCACQLGIASFGTSIPSMTICERCHITPCVCAPPVNTGWLCPKCGRGAAPSEKTCDHGGVSMTVWPIGSFTITDPAPYVAAPMPPNTTEIQLTSSWGSDDFAETLAVPLLEN